MAAAGRAERLAGGLVGAAAMIAAVTVAARLAGFGRWVVQAAEVGPNPLGTAYATANTLPNVLFEIAAGGALAGAVVPLLAVPLARSGRAEVERIAGALLGWSVAVLAPIALLVVLLAEPVMHLLMPRAPRGDLAVATMFLRVFAIQIPLYGVGVVLTGVLQAHRRFLAPALAPLLSSLVVVVVYVVFGQMAPGSKDEPAALPAAALAVLAWGTTAGVAAMSLPLLLPVRRLGVRLRPTLRFPDGVAVRARALAAAGIGALVAQQVNVVVVLVLANSFGGPGAFPVFQFTQAVYLLPYAVLAVPYATAAFPRLAEHAAREDREAFAGLTSTTTRAVLVLSGVGAAALVAAATPVEHVFVAVADGDVDGMGRALVLLAPGLVGLALILHLSRALYALDRGRAAVVATAAGWLVGAVLAVAAVPLVVGADVSQPRALAALAAAGSVGMTLAGALLLRATRRAAGAAAVRGVPRALAALLLGGVGGAVVGDLTADRLGALLAPGAAVLPWGAALVAGGVGAIVAVLLVLAVVGVVDRSAVRAVARRRPASDTTGGRAPENVDTTEGGQA